ncbi:MAG: hypothetical protein V1661_00825 [bacterium]
MEIQYKDRPSEELLNMYCRGIEKFLSAHEISLKIELFDRSLCQLKLYLEDVLISVKNIWIKGCKAKWPTIGEVDVRLFDQGIDKDSIDEAKLWRDAWNIQEQIYRKLKKSPGNVDGGDPYWFLWKLYPKN